MQPALRVMLVELLTPAANQDQSTTRRKRKKKAGQQRDQIPLPLRLSSEKKGLSVEPRFVAGCPVGQVGVHSHVISRNAEL